MTLAREMLEAAPVDLQFGVEEMAQAIDASAACARACGSLMEAEASQALQKLAGR